MICRCNKQGTFCMYLFAISKRQINDVIEIVLTVILFRKYEYQQMLIVKTKYSLFNVLPDHVGFCSPFAHHAFTIRSLCAPSSQFCIDRSPTNRVKHSQKVHLSLIAFTWRSTFVQHSVFCFCMSFGTTT